MSSNQKTPKTKNNQMLQPNDIAELAMKLNTNQKPISAKQSTSSQSSTEGFM